MHWSEGAIAPCASSSRRPGLPITGVERQRSAPLIGTTTQGGRRTPQSRNRRSASSLDCALLAASLLLQAVFNNHCQKRSFMFKKLFFAVLGFFLAAVAFAASVDVNKADQAQLESVKGIGTKLSARILDE